DAYTPSTSTPLVQQTEGVRSASLSGGGISVDSGAQSGSFDIRSAVPVEKQPKHALAVAPQQITAGRVRLSTPRVASPRVSCVGLPLAGSLVQHAKRAVRG